MWLWILLGIVGLVVLSSILVVACMWGTNRGFRPKGRIEGTLYIEGVPAPAGHWVASHLSRDMPRLSSGSFTSVMWNKYTKTTEGGHFVFKSLPAGEIGLGRAFPDGEPRNGRFGDPSTSPTSSREMTVEVRSGETTQVELGKTGYTVRGRFVFPEGISEEVDWSRCDEPFMTIDDTLDYSPPEELTEAEQTAWWKEFSKSEASKVWRDALQRMYAIRIEADGTYCVHNVYPGRYRLHIRVNRPSTFGKRPTSRPHGFFDGHIEVNASDEDGIDTIHLDDIKLRHYERLEIGDALPCRIVQTEENEPIDLTAFRGRHLLLVLWWPNYFDDKKFLKQLARLQKQFSDSQAFDLVSLGMNTEDYIIHPWMTRHDTFFNHYEVREEDSASLATAFGVLDRALFLVDPDGKIVAIEDQPKAMVPHITQRVQDSVAN